MAPSCNQVRGPAYTDNISVQNSLLAVIFCNPYRKSTFERNTGGIVVMNAG